MKTLTDRDIERAKSGTRERWLVDAARTRGIGRLVVRVLPSGGKRFYFRYSRADGRRSQIAIGPYAAVPATGSFTLTEARAQASAWTNLLLDPAIGDLAVYLSRPRAQALAGASAASVVTAGTLIAPATAASLRAPTSLTTLLEAYIVHLRSLGKSSARDAANIFKNHVVAPWPQLAQAPAANLSSQQATAMQRVLVERQQGRTAAKLRSYMRAAYSLALSGGNNAAVPAQLASFGLSSNPVAATATLTQFSRSRSRALDSRELGFFWARLGAYSGLPTTALQVALLLGGQRLAQLLRLRVQDANVKDKIMMLLDGKGRRATPRMHWLPMTPRIASLLQPLVERGAAANCPWVFSANLRTPTCAETLSEVVNEICAAMLAGNETLEKFEMRDLRRTAETQMGSLRVTRDHRAQLQSHGLSGVQEIHYDKWKYMPEKSEALALWDHKLDEWADEAIRFKMLAVATGTSNVMRFVRRKNDEQL